MLNIYPWHLSLYSVQRIIYLGKERNILIPKESDSNLCIMCMPQASETYEIESCNVPIYIFHYNLRKMISDWRFRFVSVWSKQDEICIFPIDHLAKSFFCKLLFSKLMHLIFQRSVYSINLPYMLVLFFCLFVPTHLNQMCIWFRFRSENVEAWNTGYFPPTTRGRSLY